MATSVASNCRLEAGRPERILEVSTWACLKMMGHPEKPQRLGGFIMVDHHFPYHLIASGWLGTPFS